MHQSYRITLFRSYFIVKYNIFSGNVTQTVIYTNNLPLQEVIFISLPWLFYLPWNKSYSSTDNFNLFTALYSCGLGFGFIVSCTQDLRTNTSEYTPNLFGRAQPKPQLTIPTRYHLLLLGQTSGPPLSPVHASTPPWEKPAQRMRSVMDNWRSLYASWQVSRGTRGTWACCKI